jgi:very-short-patch-repair endonuclease
MRAGSRTPEEAIARIATRQKGLVTRVQLLALGLSSAAIGRRVAKGPLIPQFPGVYRVGHRAPNIESTYLAAVLACGPGALLAGRAAGHLHGLLKHRPSRPVVVTRTERRLRGVETRRARRTQMPRGTTKNGIPVTTVPETLVDLARELREDELARACHEAGVKYRTTPRQVEAALRRKPNARGARKLRAILRGEVRVALSVIERRFVRLLRARGLSLPVTNRPVGSHRVDCRWPDFRLTVELDSYRFHNTREAWERDRRREREAHTRGDQHRRFTHDDVMRDPEPMLDELEPLLRRS